MPSFILSDHAKEEAQRRNIAIELIESILQSPQQIISAYGERKFINQKSK